MLLAMLARRLAPFPGGAAADGPAPPAVVPLVAPLPAAAPGSTIPPAPASGVELTMAGEARLRAIIDEHFEFLWRTLRRIGLSEADADDAAQQVFIVVARKLDAITPGSERAFLFSTAYRVAAQMRRSVRRRGVTSEVPEIVDQTPNAEELMEQRRARALLDEVLEALPMEIRAVFVLYELEQMTLAEIAPMLGIPEGTASSRLRRGRELFEAEIKRVKARQQGSVRR